MAKDKVLSTGVSPEDHSHEVEVNIDSVTDMVGHV